MPSDLSVQQLVTRRTALLAGLDLAPPAEADLMVRALDTIMDSLRDRVPADAVECALYARVLLSEMTVHRPNPDACSACELEMMANLTQALTARADGPGLGQVAVPGTVDQDQPFEAGPF